MSKLAKFERDEEVLTHKITVEDLDSMHTSLRKDLCDPVELKRIANKRRIHAINEGWVVLDERGLDKLEDGQEIRCFATTCGCSGQVAIVKKYDDFMFHTLHDEPIAEWFKDLAWIFTPGAAYNILVKKDTACPLFDSAALAKKERPNE